MFQIKALMLRCTYLRNNVETMLHDYHHLPSQFKHLEQLCLRYSVINGQHLTKPPPRDFGGSLKYFNVTIIVKEGQEDCWEEESLASGPDFSLLTWHSEKYIRGWKRYVSSSTPEDDCPWKTTSEKLRRQLSRSDF